MLWLWKIAELKGYVPNGVEPPPVLDTGALFSIVTGMLGIGVMRSHDKRHGVETNTIRKR